VIPADRRPTAAAAQDEAPPRVEDGLVYRLSAPVGPGPHPTVVMLHGRGGDEDAMAIFARSLPASWLVVAPRAPVPDPALGGYAWVPRSDDDWPDLDRFAEAVAALWPFVDALPERHGADRERVHLMGFSQGAATAVALALARPGAVRALASLVGFVPELDANALSRAPLAGLAVLMLVGRRDPLVPLSRARESAALLRTAGAEVTAHEHEVAHKVSSAGLRLLKAWWLERAASDGSRGAGRIL
jgi:phospholipase/carboxylesterase